MAHRAALLAGDQADLGVHLVVLKAVDDLAAGLLHALGPVDVVLLVKAGAQLDQGGDVLAVFGCGAQVFDQLGLARKTVDRDADGQHGRVVGRFADHLQKRLHALIGIGEQDIALEGSLEQALPGGQHGGLLGRKRRVGQGGALLFRQVLAQRERIAHLERRLAGQKDLRVRHVKAAAEVFLKMIADRPVQFNAHDRHPAALAKQLLHFPAEVALLRAEGLVVRVDIRVAGDAEYGLFQHVVHLKYTAGVFEQNILDRDIARFLPGQEHQRGQGGGDGQQAEPLVLFVAEQRGNVQHLALQMREGMVRVHDLRREHGRNHVFKILLDILMLGRLQLADGEAAQSLGAQAFVHVGKGAVPTLVQRFDRSVDPAELLPGGHAGFVINMIFIHSGHIAQAAHADHKEFIQIARKNG